MTNTTGMTHQESIGAAFNAGALSLKSAVDLVSRAGFGDEVHCYTSMDGRWYLWDGDAIDECGHKGARIPLGEAQHASK